MAKTKPCDDAYDWLEYNGLRLRLASNYYSDNGSGDGRKCWTLGLFRDGQDVTMIRIKLSRPGGVAAGLPNANPMRVVGSCHVAARPNNDVVTWGFWAEPLTELELDRENFRRLAGRA